MARWQQFRILPGVEEALVRLNRAGKRVIVVTNQRGIALGQYTLADVEAIHQSFERLLARHNAHVDAFLVCPHDKDRCRCRKPLPGLFEQAVARFPAITAARSVMIGDSLFDMEFGYRLGMRTVFIDRDHSRQKPGAEQARSLAQAVRGTLPQAIDMLLGADRNSS